MRTRCLPILAAIACLSLSTASAAPQIQQTTPAPGNPTAVAASMDESVAAYRKIIVLMDDVAALDPGNGERVRTAAWILFEQNRDRIEQLEDSIRTDAARNDAPLAAAFLTRLESDADLRDADKLDFRDLLDGLAHLPGQEVP